MTGAPLNILHVLRAPVGGLFRHVCDLARGQATRGHKVGVIADAASGGERADAALAALAPALALGLTRVPMTRDIGGGDIAAVRHVGQRAAEAGADVLHGHGAKGGAYARLARRPPKAIRVYTPHGGSLHYRWSTPTGLFYLTAEKVLMRRTDLFLFESHYGRDTFAAKIGDPGGHALVCVVHNGVADAEFLPIMPAADATDLVFVGELRKLKGVDVLIEAMARLAHDSRGVTATIVGDGADRGGPAPLAPRAESPSERPSHGGTSRRRQGAVQETGMSELPQHPWSGGHPGTGSRPSRPSAVQGMADELRL